MNSLASYRGEPTWWDGHPVVTGLFRTVLVIAAIVPYLMFFALLEYETTQTGEAGFWVPPVWGCGLWLLGSFVWAFLFINAALALNR